MCLRLPTCAPPAVCTLKTLALIGVRLSGVKLFGASGLVGWPTNSQETVSSNDSGSVLVTDFCFGLDGRHNKAKRISETLRLLGRFFQRFLHGLRRQHQAAWLSFFSLCHVAGSVTVSWVASCVATGNARGE